MKAIVWATVLLFVVLMIWSVVFVELVNPLVLDMLKEEQEGQADYFSDCERCGRAFSSTMQAMLTFTQQIVAGDEWGAVSIPIIEKHPWTVIFFSAVLVTVDLGLMNLILSVIVDKAQQAHNDDLKFQVQEKEEEFQRLKKQLLRICAQLDDDHSGSLTLDELLTGFDTISEFHVALSSMDVQREDISSLFNILDDDGGGSVEYDEFVDQLHKMKTQDSHVVLVFIRGHVKEIKTMMSSQAARLTTLEERLEAHEERTEQIIRLLHELNDREPGQGFSAGSGYNPMPQVWSSSTSSTQQKRGCFDLCSTPQQEKFQDRRLAPQAPASNNEEVRALKEQVAELDASLKRILGAQMAQESSPAARQLLETPSMIQGKANTGACCASGTKQVEEVNITPLPPNDQIVLPSAAMLAAKGKGKAYGKGRGGG